MELEGKAIQQVTRRTLHTISNWIQLEDDLEVTQHNSNALWEKTNIRPHIGNQTKKQAAEKHQQQYNPDFKDDQNIYFDTDAARRKEGAGVGLVRYRRRKEIEIMGFHDGGNRRRNDHHSQGNKNHPLTHPNTIQKDMNIHRQPKCDLEDKPKQPRTGSNVEPGNRTQCPNHGGTRSGGSNPMGIGT